MNEKKVVNVKESAKRVNVNTRFILQISPSLIKDMYSVLHTMEKEGKQVHSINIVENARFMVDFTSLGVRQQTIYQQQEVLHGKIGTV